jgi:hypothetical protein
MTVGDTYFAGVDASGNAVWSTPTAWSVSALYEHHFSPVFSIDPQISYAQLHWSGSMGELSNNSQTWVLGAVAHWDPVPLLDFAFELMYQNTHQSTPDNWTTGGVTTGTVDGVVSSFKNNEDGFAGRFYITRNW